MRAARSSAAAAPLGTTPQPRHARRALAWLSKSATALHVEIVANGLAVFGLGVISYAHETRREAVSGAARLVLVLSTRLSVAEEADTPCFIYVFVFHVFS